MDLSLNSYVEKIYAHNTKEYFSEVVTSYQIGNYRSAIVMLWTVVVCDLLYKLEHLVDINNDKKARKILIQINELRERDERSPTWEKELLERVKNSTKLLNSLDYENLIYLQKQRHLCAHPTLNDNNKLHSPNKETTRSLITNTLQGLFVKPPFYTKDILSNILEDLADNRDYLELDEGKAKSFLESRYLNRLDNDVLENIYKSLWKFVFRIDDENCSKNRAVNCIALNVIGNKIGEKNLERLIKNENDYFGSISKDEDILDVLIKFLTYNHKFYNLLGKDFQLVIEMHIDGDVNNKLHSHFIYSDTMKYYDAISSWLLDSEHVLKINFEAWKYLINIFDNGEWESLCCKLLSIYYGISQSYDIADQRFNDLIKPLLHYFNANDAEFLLKKIEDNPQTHERRRAIYDHEHIFHRIWELSDDVGSSALIIDLDKYPSFSLYSNFDN